MNLHSAKSKMCGRLGKGGCGGQLQQCEMDAEGWRRPYLIISLEQIGVHSFLYKTDQEIMMIWFKRVVLQPKLSTKIY